MTEIGERLRELLEEARLSDELADLAALLDGYAREARHAAAGARGKSEDTVEVPMRYGLVGDSPAMNTVFEQIERVAPTNVSVLIRGETGTGKELVARAMHDHSPRHSKRFLAENCAAVPANLLESELFGHVKGSFTGAIADRDGHFVAASGGTLFLDEIGDMPLEMQVKLLRVLEQREVRPVGSNQVVSVDVRLVAATHRDLAAMVSERAFREDLYYRLNVVTLELPPLRERKGDVPLLVRYFLRAIARESDGVQAELEPEALTALCEYQWPGNVRQLENELRRATAFARGPITRADLSDDLAQGRT